MGLPAIPSQSSEQLWVHVDPNNTSYSSGLVATMHANHNDDKSAVTIITGDEGTGDHYGIKSNAYGNIASNNSVHGISSYTNHKGTGNSYGLYIDNNSSGFS